MLAGDLPQYPAKGDRRRLDQEWLELLHRDGAFRHLEAPPPAPEALLRAVEEFNQGLYWQCHETLEGVWLPERYPLRLFYHGLIKAAVGLLHLKRRNRHGALVKLGDAEYTLYPFAPQFMGLDVGRLRRDLATRRARAGDPAPVDWEAIAALPAVRIHPSRTLPGQAGG